MQLALFKAEVQTSDRQPTGEHYGPPPGFRIVQYENGIWNYHAKGLHIRCAGGPFGSAEQAIRRAWMAYHTWAGNQERWNAEGVYSIEYYER